MILNHNFIHRLTRIVFNLNKIILLQKIYFKLADLYCKYNFNYLCKLKQKQLKIHHNFKIYKHNKKNKLNKQYSTSIIKQVQLLIQISQNLLHQKQMIAIQKINNIYLIVPKIKQIIIKKIKMHLIRVRI